MEIKKATEAVSSGVPTPMQLGHQYPGEGTAAGGAGVCFLTAAV